MKILMVLTSHSELGKTGKKTGFWIEEFAAPYYAFLDAGAIITIASPKGGRPPVDPSSDTPENQTPATIRYKADKKLQDIMGKTEKLSSMSSDDYDAIFYPGGHGPLWDLTKSAASINLLEHFWNSNKPVVAVCHAPAVLLNARDKAGEMLLKGKKVTGFSNSEEAAVQLTEIVPFSLEDELRYNGGVYSKKENWTSYVVEDGMLITGQNPASSEAAAEALLKILALEPILADQ
ncbi:MAG: type 1 glutamine amidotransferase domain-containing protein [Saprospiraceae bacterium]